MSVIIITGSAGLIGSEAVEFYCKKGYTVVGIDNNMRKYFFGEDGSTIWRASHLQELYSNYIHMEIDIRDFKEINKIFSKYSTDLELVLHSAAQPSHDWAAKEPITDFTINANGTLNLLECTRIHAINCPFIFVSTNKVYGDTPNHLPLIEKETRWKIAPNHRYALGIDESMSIDQCKHSVFGASKLAGDIMVQEYGKYFNMKTAAFRGGCLTGPNHSGAMLHGFLSYLLKCLITGKEYIIYGYKGKQVRDNIHSSDLINAFYHFQKKPRNGEVYNIGGGIHSNCSILEAIKIGEKLSNKKMNFKYVNENRIGDHIWWISDVRKFMKHYPNWHYRYNLEQIIEEIIVNSSKRWL
ncbi:NAD-dependent epimerase/dehydratase family protein [bacterium]|nr:NAD-dependent epimerase/dehydratase family protein [bacterium]